MKKREPDQYSDQETQRRAEAALRAAFKTPAKPQSEMRLGKSRRAKPGAKERDLLSIKCDADELAKMLNTLTAELSKSPLKIGQRFADLLNSAHEIALVEIDVGSAAANEMIVRFKPSNRLRMLCSALRAGNFDDIAVHKS